MKYILQLSYLFQDLEIHINEDSLDKILKNIKLRNLHSQIVTKGEVRR